MCRIPSCLVDVKKDKVLFCYSYMWIMASLFVVDTKCILAENDGIFMLF